MPDTPSSFPSPEGGLAPAQVGREAFLFPKGSAMTLQEQIAADIQTRDAAQAALDAANAQLTADQAKADAIAPHLSLLVRIEERVASAEQTVKDDVLSAVAEMRALFNQ